MYSVAVTVFLAFLCAGTSRVAADASAKDLTCNFNQGYCGWTNDTIATGVFLRESNATTYRLIPTGCNFLVASTHAGSSGIAKLDSPQFTIMDSTVVLQVNFSYWLTNPNSQGQGQPLGTQLKLSVVTIDASGPNTTNLVWDTRANQQSTEQWNATNVNIKDLPKDKKFKLIFDGVVNHLDAVAALERIVVTELSAASVPSLDKLPNVTYHLEKIVDNENLCSGSVGIASSVYLSLISVFALLVFQRF